MCVFAFFNDEHKRVTVLIWDRLLPLLLASLLCLMDLFPAYMRRLIHFHTQN